jgi:hypothetical protein
MTAGPSTLHSNACDAQDERVSRFPPLGDLMLAVNDLKSFDCAGGTLEVNGEFQRIGRCSRAFSTMA